MKKAVWLCALVFALTVSAAVSVKAAGIPPLCHPDEPQCPWK
jgi:hypothetical protein